MRRSNIGRVVAATLGAVGAVLAARPAAAQVAASPHTLQKPGVAVAERPPSPVPPAPDASMRAFQAVASWVKDWRVGEPAEPGLPAAAGAYVTLRMDGQVIGRGMELASAPAGDAACIARAAAQAIEEARRRVPIEHDALFEENLKAIAPRVAITLELAGALVPFAPKEYADAAAEVNPGVEGVAVRAGERTAAMFPEQMLATGTDGGAGLSALVSKLTEDPTAGLKKPAELAAQRGLVFYRFKTSTVGQAKAGGSAEFLQRGGRVTPSSAITNQGLRAWASTLFRSIEARWECKQLAEFDPVRLDSMASPSTAEVFFLIESLESYSYLAGPERDRCNSVKQRLIDFAMQDGRTPVWEDPIAAAILSTGIGGDYEDSVLQKCGKYVTEAFDETRGFTPAVPPASHGLLAYAIVLATNGKGRAAIRSVYLESGPGGLVAQMPGLGFAEIFQSQFEALGAPGYNRRTYEIKGATALRDMRSLVWQHQLKAEDLPHDQQDLAGGIVFTASGKGQVLPTWQAARPLAFIATMLGDERLTSDAEVPQELSRLLASLRFLRQLTADEAAGHLYANPALAVGGVRASPFDQRMPPEATALTLMTVCETLQSLEKIRKRHEGKAEPGVEAKPAQLEPAAK